VLAELSPPEALHLLQPIVLSDYTRLPDSMQTAAYDIHTIDRFKYPFYQACAPGQRPDVTSKQICTRCYKCATIRLPADR